MSAAAWRSLGDETSSGGEHTSNRAAESRAVRRDSIGLNSDFELRGTLEEIPDAYSEEARDSSSSQREESSATSASATSSFERNAVARSPPPW